MPRAITFHFTLRDAAGRLLETSLGGPPIRYVDGDGTIVDGLAAALPGWPAGARRKVTVPAAQGYGERDESLVRRVPRSAVPVDTIKVGDQFQAGTDRHAPIVTIAAIAGDEVVLDANHPLAGVELHFEVEIVAVEANA
ncbi:MAG TPA: FKBP-type peptidyl-prolyl cis-trans isomerase [Opitutaceae bacterium]|nr:FKBP-type peptidyl-prolyl cis-trans isomerase [Opitutaceae bacterium]